MLICIDSILSTTETSEVAAALAKARFVDGRTTAGWHASSVKDNEQAAPEDPSLARIKGRLADKLRAHPLFAMAARPRRLSPLIFSRYRSGMAYGAHVDDALMGELRTDLSYTLFLAEPSSYEGGELVIESTAGELPVKLQAGSLVLYPSTSLHRVAPVTSGERLVAVGWVQSQVRDAAAREILLDLETAKRELFTRDGKSPTFDLVAKSFANLLRRWAEA